MPLPTLIAIIALATGFGLEKKSPLSKRSKDWAARILINLCYPSLIFASLLMRVNLETLYQLWRLPLFVSFVLLLGLTLGIASENRVGLAEEGQRRSYRFLSLLPNYSYLPLMVAQALWGDSGIGLVAIASIGADLVLWTLGVPQIMQVRRLQWRGLVKNPPLIALVLAFFFLQPNSQNWRELLEPFLPWLRMIGSSTVPLSMLLLGTHLARPTQAKQNQKAHAVLLFLRLVLIPGLCYCILCAYPQILASMARGTLILVASMPGAILSLVLSDLHKASPSFTARHLLLGHVAWLFTGPIWLWLVMRLP